MKIGAVVVSYNSSGELRKCVNSFKSQKIANQNAKFIACVVDNASKDNSVEIAKNSADHVIENKHNAGFSVAVNQGLKWLLDEGCDYLLILNPDAITKTAAIENMLEMLTSDENIGAVGPQMMNSDGTSANGGYYLKAPSVLTVLMFYTRLRPWALKHPKLLSLYEENLGNKVVDVEQIPGAAIFTSKDRLEKIGLLSEEFTIWFEDVEWCYRARKLGYRMVFVPNSHVVHEGGVSFAKWNDINKAVTFYVSMKTFFRLHKPLSLPLVVFVVSTNAFLTYVKNHDRDQVRFIKRFVRQRRGLLPK